MLPVLVWIHPSLILILYGSLEPQRSFVQFFVWRPTEGVTHCPLLSLTLHAFIHPKFSFYKPLSNHKTLYWSAPLSPQIYLSHPLSTTSSTFLLTLSCWEQDSAASWQLSTLPHGRKNKQESTCSWGILITSISLATLPAKLQESWGTQWTLNETD